MINTSTAESHTSDRFMWLMTQVSQPAAWMNRATRPQSCCICTNFQTPFGITQIMDASWQSPALGTISESFPRTGGQAAHAGAELCLMLSRPCHLARSSQWKETWASNSAASGHNSASWSDLIFTCNVIKWTWEARHRRHRYLLPSASCLGQDRAAQLQPPAPGLRAPSH